MKLCSFTLSGQGSWGAVDGNNVRDLGWVLKGQFADLRSAIEADAYEDLRLAQNKAPTYSLSEIAWSPVLPNPNKIFCIGLNYEDHRQETGRPETRYPTVFSRFANSQTGHLCDIPLSHLSTQLDYEGELAVVIGKSGRYIRRSEAKAYIAGYACYNDVSVRDWQNHSHQFIPGKNFPGTGAFGPWMITSDEFDDERKLRLQTRVNGVAVQEATLDQMIFDIPSLIEYCSSFTNLDPGDVIVSGTPGGVGAKRKPPLWLKPGDITEVEIESVGVLQNTIIQERID